MSASLRREIDAALDLIDAANSPESVQAAHRAMADAIEEWDFVSNVGCCAVVESTGAWWLVFEDRSTVTVTRHATEESARAELAELTGEAS